MYIFQQVHEGVLARLSNLLLETAGGAGLQDEEITNAVSMIIYQMSSRILKNVVNDNAKWQQDLHWLDAMITHLLEVTDAIIEGRSRRPVNMKLVNKYLTEKERP